MDEAYVTGCIVEGVKRYFRIFAQSGIVELHRGNLEWINPCPGEVGPAIVYGVNLQPGDSLSEMIAGVKAGTIPSFWYIMPGSTPDNIAAILKEKGFVGELPTDPDKKEYGMALVLQAAPAWPAKNPRVEIRQVRTFAEFAQWIDTVNTALHGWKIIDAEHYFTWVSQPGLAFYLGYIDGVPVSTAATIAEHGEASLEFVSTLEPYRKRGAATAVCVHALEQLKAQQCKTVILGSSPEATAIYRRLGFMSYYEKVLLTFKG